MRPNSQRALILQGGGSLDAYEAGVCEALYEKITKTGKPLLNTVYPALPIQHTNLLQLIIQGSFVSLS
jgi:hypothetical protein